MTQNSKPAIDVWDSCCLIGVLNGEADKLPALLAQTRLFESGASMLGLPMAALDEVVMLSDGTPADEKVKQFLLNPYVLTLQPNLDTSFKSKNLRMRFDTKNMPELSAKAIAFGVPKDQSKKLGVKDSEIVATALVYKAARLTTYDPFLIFLGREFLEKETGLVIDKPAPLYLPFPEEEKHRVVQMPFTSNLSFRRLTPAEQKEAEKRWADDEFIPTGEYWLATFNMDGEKHYAGVRSGHGKTVAPDIRQFQINLRVSEKAFNSDIFIPEARVADITKEIGEAFEQGEYWNKP